MSSVQGDPEVLRKLGVGQRRGARRWIGWVVGLVVVLGVTGGLVVWRAKAAQPKGDQWVTAAVELGDLRETVTATGTLQPLDSVEVGAEVTGRVVKVHVDVNDLVKEGQVLVEIDTEQLTARVEESSAQLRSAQASLQNAKAGVREAEAAAARTRELHKRGLASDKELEAAEATLERSKAQVSSATAQVTVASAGLKSSNTSLAKAIIRSPIDGIVLARSVEQGQTVTAGFQTPVLLTLARDLRNMELRVDIDEADVGKVKEQQRATFVVDAYPKRKFESSVVRLGNLPKAGTTVVTYEAELTVDNADLLLKPGMTATATIITHEKTGVLTVPNAALRFQPEIKSSNAAARRGGLPLPGLGGPMGRGGARPASSARDAGAKPAQPKQAVWILNQGQLQKVEVEVGSTDGRRTEVRAPELSQGTQVVVDVAEAAP